MGIMASLAQHSGPLPYLLLVIINLCESVIADCEQASNSESADHPIISGRSYSETSQDSTLELANYIVTLQAN